ncbi:26S proteasome non-ATPase regulatory subunit [Wickerhamomyces ciferrii]|uniref:26S proteasome non-ATPase regulatory subunit n=1 Tax=Wickerhamomyces ciferrii (strain ATCC 14091 / BCRC 22168 / CBS 111 / JCM 3599 / NBRC 0793 / NRRL Y-1031 F-60-10) TaxID=1206466 RepID=K0L0D6_WICCF|nr:26S proteasome non-ATPase regulatory subunit [Wickerhamomyces ciferrii]CCH46888.1 26S proteasome non-ATPase regulatory subunit [Wickerhamomyces ciferrii]
MTQEEQIVIDNEPTPEEVNRLTIAKIENGFQLVSKTVQTFDQRYIFKTLRDLVSIRKQLNLDVLQYLINKYLDDDYQNYLLKFIDGKLETNDELNQFEGEILPEINFLIHLLVQFYLLDKGELSKLDELNVEYILKLIKLHNRRSLDLINAKIWFYISRTKELLNDLISIRSELLLALRISTIRHDDETSGSLITLILRNYILVHDYSQASNFIEKIELPKQVSNSIETRYYFYLAKINSIQLNYSDSHDFVTTAIRKAPQTTNAIGFLTSAYKLNVLIELLTGDIPELSFFQKPGFEKVLKPYQDITKAVKLGDLKIFNETLTKYHDLLIKDDNYSLVTRLRSNVIKTGIRIISLSYTKISLKDICIKLHLDNESSAEYIVSKSIRDGVIDAKINHQKGYVESNEIKNIYSTNQPQDQFNQRINFVNSLHNDSIKAMRYPPSSNRTEISNKNESQDDENELINALQEDFEDDFF